MPATQFLTISQFARAVGIPVSTVRFYERRGLLRPDARTSANYRAYSQSTVERLRFIRAAQATGFSLKDIRERLSLIHSDDLPCAEVDNVITRRLADVRQRMTELQRVETALARAKDSCCKTEPDFCRQIIRLRGNKPVHKKMPSPLLTLH